VSPVATNGHGGTRLLDRTHPRRLRLDELLTRCFYSAAGYVFECDPFVVPEDDEVLQAIAAVRADDRRHAHVLGAVIQGVGGVPAPGVFPWWDLDLNYLTVPCLARFVVETLEDECRLYEDTVASWPEDDPGSRAALSSILADKRAHLERLRPVSEAATKREIDANQAKIDALKRSRAARLAKEKAAKEAARKAAAAKPVAGAPAAKPAAAAAGPALLDPKEPGISPKERGRRTVLRARAAAGKPLSLVGGAPASGPAPAPGPAAVPAATVDVSALPDPNEPGISPKEKARRQIARQRASAVATGAVGSAVASAPPPPSPATQVDVSSLPDPDEPGISPKEKGKRQVMRQRALAAAQASGGGAPAASNAPAGGGVVAAAASPTVSAPPPATPPAAAAAAVEDIGDPDEPGISPKEKARRTVLRNRAKKA
jgi:hypothetical protein